MVSLRHSTTMCISWLETSPSHYICCLNMRQPIVTSDNSNLIGTHTMIKYRQTLHKSVGFYLRNCRGPFPLSIVSNRGRFTSVEMMRFRLPSTIDKITVDRRDVGPSKSRHFGSKSRHFFQRCHSHLITHLAFSWTIRSPLIADIAYMRKSLRTR